MITIPRSVGAEVLDGLEPTDPAAQRSRRDLRRVHRAMRTRSILLRALQQLTPPGPDATSIRVLELGAGDGTLMLGVARAMARWWPPVELTLLDRQALVDGETIAEFAGLGWTTRVTVADALDWADSPSSDPAARWDLIVANLFLHHFEGAQLSALLGAVAAVSDRFVAFEPRRDWVALAGSHLVGSIGAGEVTRRDAVLSVHAGFRGAELSARWAANGLDWRVQEYRAGPFSHCFCADRAEVS